MSGQRLMRQLGIVLQNYRIFGSAKAQLQDLNFLSAKAQLQDL